MVYGSSIYFSYVKRKVSGWVNIFYEYIDITVIQDDYYGWYFGLINNNIIISFCSCQIVFNRLYYLKRYTYYNRGRNLEVWYVSRNSNNYIINLFMNYLY